MIYLLLVFCPSVPPEEITKTGTMIATTAIAAIVITVMRVLFLTGFGLVDVSMMINKSGYLIDHREIFIKMLC